MDENYTVFPRQLTKKEIQQAIKKEPVFLLLEYTSKWDEMEGLSMIQYVSVCAYLDA